jgi:hypothetical protein
MRVERKKNVDEGRKEKGKWMSKKPAPYILPPSLIGQNAKPYFSVCAHTVPWSE